MPEITFSPGWAHCLSLSEAVYYSQLGPRAGGEEEEDDAQHTNDDDAAAAKSRERRGPGSDWTLIGLNLSHTQRGGREMRKINSTRQIYPPKRNHTQ